MNRHLALALLWIWLAALTGCGFPVKSRAVEQLRCVETLGCDVSREEVTVSAAAGSGGEGVPLALAAQGGSIPQALENLRAWSDARELFFAHVRYVVTGERAARAGLGPLLDYFARSTQTTLELPLLVVRGGEARSLVVGSEQPGRDVTALLSSMQRQAEQTGTARCFTLREIARRMGRSGAALCCAVEARPTGENAPSAGEGAEAVLCAGYAVLKNGVLAGFLDAEAALGADLLMGLAGQADYVLPCGDGSATVTLLDGNSQLTPAWEEDGSLTVRVATRVRAGVLSTDGEDVTDRAVRRGLSLALAQAVAAQEEAALAASRDLDADFLELRLLIGQKAPLAAGSSLASLRWQIRVEAELERSYDLDGGSVVHE